MTSAERLAEELQDWLHWSDEELKLLANALTKAGWVQVGDTGVQISEKLSEMDGANAFNSKQIAADILLLVRTLVQTGRENEH